MARTLTRKFPENSRQGRIGLGPGRARSGPRSLVWAPAAPRARERASLHQHGPPLQGTALVCLCAASPRSYGDLPGRGLARGRGEQTCCGQQGAGGEARVIRPQTAGHCLGSDPNSEGKRTSQGRRAVAERGTAPAGSGLQVTSCPRPRAQVGGPKPVGVRQVAMQGRALSWREAWEPGWGAQRSLEGGQLQGRSPERGREAPGCPKGRGRALPYLESMAAGGKGSRCFRRFLGRPAPGSRPCPLCP